MKRMRSIVVMITLCALVAPLLGQMTEENMARMDISITSRVEREGVLLVDVTVPKGGYIYLQSEIGKPVAFTGKKGVNVSSFTAPKGHDKFGDLVIGGEGKEVTKTFEVAYEGEGDPPAITMEYQICLDMGVCLPPKTKTITFTHVTNRETKKPVDITTAGAAKANKPDAAATDTPDANETVPDEPAGNSETEATTKTATEKVVPDESTTDAEDATATDATVEKATTEKKDDGSFLDRLKDKFLAAGESNIFIALLISFLAGIASFLLPCIYPLLPVTIGYLGARQEGEVKGNFVGSLFFGLGIVVTYTVFGIVASRLGISFGFLASNPVVLVVISAIFVYLTFSMFGFYDFKVPSFMQKAKDSSYKQNASYLEKFFMGAMTGLVASPCVGPVVAVILILSASNPLGYLYMMFYAIGFSSVLVLLGTFSSLLKKLPKSGGWMNIVKYVFAVLIALFTLMQMNLFFEHIGFHASSWLFAIATFALVTVIIALAGYKKLDAYLKEERFTGLVVILLFIMGMLVYTGVQGERHFGDRTTVDYYTQYTEMESAIAAAKESGKRIFIDFWDPSCKNCKLLYNNVLTKPPLAGYLQEHFVFVKINTAEHPDVKKTYSEKAKTMSWNPWILVITDEGTLLYEKNKFGLFDETLGKEILTALKELSPPDAE